MNEQITAIAALLLEINGKEKYTAFFDFSGHVRTFSIRIYSGKWSQGKDPLFNLSLQNKDGQQWHNGFTIEDAALCRDAGKRYLALRVLGQPAGQTYTVERLLLRRRDPLLPEHLTEEIRRQTRARAGMALAKLTPAAELAAIDVRLSQLQTCLKEVQTW